MSVSGRIGHRTFSHHCRDAVVVVVVIVVVRWYTPADRCVRNGAFGRRKKLQIISARVRRPITNEIHAVYSVFSRVSCNFSPFNLWSSATVAVHCGIARRVTLLRWHAKLDKHNRYFGDDKTGETPPAQRTIGLKYRAISVKHSHVVPAVTRTRALILFACNGSVENIRRRYRLAVVGSCRDDIFGNKTLRRQGRIWKFSERRFKYNKRSEHRNCVLLNRIRSACSV